ncbi:MAG: putative selenium-dependent hydroxylase accessory protein YqeC [Candidatus Wallbacteria bacterium HGW-Wallbacteria-1]|jgi:probable selenium-dependent hydroxylase accessory protein YqeC|uniref:Putative selenium-dependent hydroxylase accessory protein YqeC n=1 Tax=Candidatus Wallbacteria bacterium HGW-Wallbacteria-1 TaxID=2013854 RepID=A0A2N1PMQ5_9BACT|nr:MAG: putative selenium-dependent hydroxylase accessory protein YqeC [Candidatus Wallbacteria bacterium HGW-Wallbacteria-1]
MKKHDSAWDELRAFFGTQRKILLLGSGGKTTLMSVMCRLILTAAPRSFASTTTKIALPADWADHIIDLQSRESLCSCPERGVVFFHSGTETDRATGVVKALGISSSAAEELSGMEPLIIEADGSRGLPLKAPASWEPVLVAPPFGVVLVMGVNGIGKPLSNRFVHRCDLFSEITGLHHYDPVTEESLAQLILSPAGYGRQICDNPSAIIFNMAQLNSCGEFETGPFDEIMEKVRKVNSDVLGFAGRIGEGVLIRL